MLNIEKKIISEYSELLPSSFEAYFSKLSRKDKVSVLEQIDKNMLVKVFRRAKLSVKADIFLSLPNELREYLVSFLDREEQEELEILLPRVNKKEYIPQQNDLSQDILQLLRKPFVAKHGETVKQVIKNIETSEKTVYKYIFVLDDQDHITSVVNIESLFNSKKNTLMENLINSDIVYVTINCLKESKIDYLFSKYSVLPIVDREQRLIGILKSESWVAYKNNNNLKDYHAVNDMLSLFDVLLSCFMEAFKIRSSNEK